MTIDIHAAAAAPPTHVTGRALIRPARGGPRTRRRLHAAVAATATVFGLWLGVTAPSVSPVSPTLATAPLVTPVADQLDTGSTTPDQAPATTTQALQADRQHGHDGGRGGRDSVHGRQR